jgi:hypothetical protein
MKDKITELTVYESPDGGRTIYKRKQGTNTRELYLRDPLLEQELINIEKEDRWAQIYLARKGNPALDDLCQQVEMLYQLSKRD